MLKFTSFPKVRFMSVLKSALALNSAFLKIATPLKFAFKNRASSAKVAELKSASALKTAFVKYAFSLNTAFEKSALFSKFVSVSIALLNLVPRNCAFPLKIALSKFTTSSNLASVKIKSLSKQASLKSISQLIILLLKLSFWLNKALVKSIFIPSSCFACKLSSQSNLAHEKSRTLNFPISIVNFCLK